MHFLSRFWNEYGRGWVVVLLVLGLLGSLALFASFVERNPSMTLSPFSSFSPFSPFSSVATIDLGKVLRAEVMMASRVMQKATSNAELNTLKQSNISLKKAVREVAGQDRLVLVAPAVLQGGEDITDRVLQKMHLPTDVPATLPKFSALFPDVASEKSVQSLKSVKSVKKREMESSVWQP